MPDPAEDADDVLLARAQEGDRAAFVALLRRYDPVLRRLAWHVLRDRALVGEVLGQVYRKAFLGVGGTHGGASARAWLSQLTWQACVGGARRAAHDLHDNQAPAIPGLAEALADLPAEQRAAVLLVDAEGYGFRDAARVLGVAPATVASHLARAREGLRAGLEHPGSPT